MRTIDPVLGTMNFGPQINCDDSVSMVDLFLQSGYREVDTAYVYNNGDSERFLAEALKKGRVDTPIVATKVNPRVTGKLDETAVRFQLEESLTRMQLSRVDILYLHFPDPTTPVNETLECLSALHQEGLFGELGVSNYASWQVVDIVHRCRSNGWLQPTIYQGLYNALSRGVEDELIPALREFGIRFYAYNPLAGGILSGRYSDLQNVAEGRFTVRPNYQTRYWKKEFFEGLEDIKLACNECSVGMVESAFRWLIHSSKLDSSAGDRVIIGASSESQLRENLSFFKHGALEQRVIGAFDSAWRRAKPEAPQYFRTV